MISTRTPPTSPCLVSASSISLPCGPAGSRRWTPPPSRRRHSRSVSPPCAERCGCCAGASWPHRSPPSSSRTWPAAAGSSNQSNNRSVSQPSGYCIEHARKHAHQYIEALRLHTCAPQQQYVEGRRGSEAAAGDGRQRAGCFHHPGMVQARQQASHCRPDFRAPLQPHKASRARPGWAGEAPGGWAASWTAACPWWTCAARRARGPCTRWVRATMHSGSKEAAWEA